MKDDDLESEIYNLNKTIERLHTVLKGLSQRHEWHPDAGQCICEWHTESRALLQELENKSKLTKHLFQQATKDSGEGSETP